MHIVRAAKKGDSLGVDDCRTETSVGVVTHSVSTVSALPRAAPHAQDRTRRRVVATTHWTSTQSTVRPVFYTQFSLYDMPIQHSTLFMYFFVQ